jgi:hypothetical protein
MLVLAALPGAKSEPHATIAGAGHFLQEDAGEELAHKIVACCARKLVGPTWAWPKSCVRCVPFASSNSLAVPTGCQVNVRVAYDSFVPEQTVIQSAGLSRRTVRELPSTNWFSRSRDRLSVASPSWRTDEVTCTRNPSCRRRWEPPDGPAGPRFSYRLHLGSALRVRCRWERVLGALGQRRRIDQRGARG